MGFHHVYDNANISECRWMISEIENHMQELINRVHRIRARNKEKRKARLAKEEVSSDESEGSDGEEVQNYDSSSEEEVEEEEKSSSN